MDEAEKELQKFQDSKDFYNRLMQKNQAIDYVVIYSEIAHKWVDEKTKGFDIRRFFSSTATTGKQMASDMKDYVIGEGLELGGSVLGGVIGSFCAPPLGTVLGSLIGWGLGVLAKDTYQKSTKRKKALKFAFEHLT